MQHAWLPSSPSQRFQIFCAHVACSGSSTPLLHCCKQHSEMPIVVVAARRCHCACAKQAITASQQTHKQTAWKFSVSGSFPRDLNRCCSVVRCARLHNKNNNVTTILALLVSPRVAYAYARTQVPNKRWKAISATFEKFVVLKLIASTIVHSSHNLWRTIFETVVFLNGETLMLSNKALTVIITCETQEVHEFPIFTRNWIAFNVYWVGAGRDMVSWVELSFPISLLLNYAQHFFYESTYCELKRLKNTWQFQYKLQVACLNRLHIKVLGP